VNLKTQNSLEVTVIIQRSMRDPLVQDGLSLKYKVSNLSIQGGRVVVLDAQFSSTPCPPGGPRSGV